MSISENAANQPYTGNARDYNKRNEIPFKQNN